MSLLGILYGFAVTFRNFLYKKGILKSRILKNPVISVGNITLGGTGKTPFVMFLAQIFKEAGYQPVVLSRGYKGKAESSILLVSDGQTVFCQPEDCGDEPLLMARKLKGVPIVVGKDRYRAGRSIENQYAKIIYILDDGYQHLQLQRNLNILILDGTDPFGGQKMVPDGRLREPLKAIERADLIVVTRSHFPIDLDELEMNIRQKNKIVPVSYCYHDVVSIWDLRSGESFLPRDFIGRRVVAMAAIGNPGGFLRDLTHYQMRVVDRRLFPDHHDFHQSELDTALERLSKLRADAIITTEKDAVRLEKLTFHPGQIFALEIEVKAENPGEYKTYLLNELEHLPKPH